MSQTNLSKLELIQNRALLAMIGVPLSTRVQDLQLEVDAGPLRACYKPATAYFVKNIEDTHQMIICLMAHAIPPTRLKQKIWQHTSDEIFWKVDKDPAHNSCKINSTSCSQIAHTSDFSPPNPEAAPQMPLQHRQPLCFTSRITPWTIFGPNTKINSKIPGVIKSANANINHSKTKPALAKLNPGFTLWIDGSVLESGSSGSLCNSHHSFVNP